MSVEPGVALPVVREDAPSEAVDPYVIAGWDSRAHAPGLSAGTLRSARAVSEALFSTESGPPPAARLDWLEADLGDFFGHANWRARLLFRACLFAITWVAPLLVGRLGRLASLPIERRVEALERMEETPLSLAFFGAKAVLCIVWYEHPDSAREIGWSSTCLGPRP